MADEQRRRITLVEVLVVACTLLLLAGLLIPSTQPAIGRMRTVTCFNNIRQLALANFSQSINKNALGMEVIWRHFTIRGKLVTPTKTGVITLGQISPLLGRPSFCQPSRRRRSIRRLSTAAQMMHLFTTSRQGPAFFCVPATRNWKRRPAASATSSTAACLI